VQVQAFLDAFRLLVEAEQEVAAAAAAAAPSWGSIDGSSGSAGGGCGSGRSARCKNGGDGGGHARRLSSGAAPPLRMSPAVEQQQACLTAAKVVAADLLCGGPQLRDLTPAAAFFNRRLNQIKDARCARQHGIAMQDGSTVVLGPAVLLGEYTGVQLPTVLFVLALLPPPEARQDGISFLLHTLNTRLQTSSAGRRLPEQLAELQLGLPHKLLTLRQLQARVLERSAQDVLQFANHELCSMTRTRKDDLDKRR